MKKIPAFLLLLLSQFSFSQNLVPNPSFEQYDTCPNNLDQVRFATGWSAYSQSPDYFNSCAVSNQFIDVPSNNFGFRYPKSGNAYIGLYTYADAGNYREYAGVELAQTLVIGQKYYASFYVSRASNNLPFTNVATNKIGLKLSTIAYTFSSPAPIVNYAQLYADSIITDTLNWTEIAGSFIADSAYHYLSIGNFFTDSTTSYIRFGSVSAGAYYYVDDIFLSTDSIEGINDHNSFESIKIFPNPARDWIVVEGEDISKLSLFDILGNLCFSMVVSSSALVKINITEFNKGMYFLKVQTIRESIIQKLVIQ